MAYTEIDKGSTDGTCAFLAAAIDQLFSVRQPKPCTLILHTTLIASYLHVLLHFLQSVGKARRGKGDMSVGIDVFSPDPNTIFHTLTDALKSATMCDNFIPWQTSGQRHSRSSDSSRRWCY